MAVTLAQVQSGIARYIEEEILSKIGDWRKWVLGAGASMAISNASNIFTQLKGNPVVKAIGVIDDNDMIDIETLHREFAKQAQMGAITFNVPILGALTLNAHDVEKMYQYIIGG